MLVVVVSSSCSSSSNLIDYFTLLHYVKYNILMELLSD